MSRWASGSRVLTPTSLLRHPEMHPPAVAKGQLGVLRLRLVNRGGKTIIAEQMVTAPFKLFTPTILVDGTLLLQVCVMGPGIRSGDKYELDVSVESQARALVVFPSATKLLGSIDGASAAQEVGIHVAAGGALEYYPGLTIPFPDAVFRQRVDAIVDRGARFGMLEMWSMGRVHRHEVFRFTDIWSRTKVSIDGDPVYRDTISLRPAQFDIDGPGMLEGHCYLASGYWYWDDPLEHQDISSEVLELVTGRPTNGHLYLRCLATDGVQLRREVHHILAQQRQAWGLSPVKFGRFTNMFG